MRTWRVDMQACAGHTFGGLPRCRVKLLNLVTPRQRRHRAATHSTLTAFGKNGVPDTQEVYIEAQQDRTLSDGRCPFTGSTTTPSDLDTASSSSGSKRPGLSVSLPYRDYLPFKDEPYQIDLKFDRISRNAIFEIDEHHEADMARKAHILATRPPELVLPGVAGCESVKQEAMDVVVQLLVSSFPDRFQFEGQNLLNTATGEVWELHNSNKNPMEIIARLVQEDVVVMQRINGHMILSCGCVVSPLGWSASHKVGLDLKGIHDPVPHFNNGPALKFVSKILEKGLKAETPLARANWFIVDTDEHSLFADAEHIPPHPDLGPITLENAADRLFLRCERQVVTRLPESQAVMFTFRTYIRPLRELEARTEVMQRLLAAFTALPDEVVAYRHIADNTRQTAVQYLQHVANSHS